jgi:uncharacterized protein (DUF58 family)
LPSIGIAPVIDVETKKTVWINTSSAAEQHKFNRFYEERAQKLAELCKRCNANYLAVHTQEDYVPKLIKLFKIRNKIKK